MYDGKYSRRLSVVENDITFSEDWKKHLSDLYKYVFFESFVDVDLFSAVMCIFKHTKVTYKVEGNICQPEGLLCELVECAYAHLPCLLG
jgi:hypothetical protein